MAVIDQERNKKRVCRLLEHKWWLNGREKTPKDVRQRMSDTLQFVVTLGKQSLTHTSDKLKCVGHCFSVTVLLTTIMSSHELA